MPGRPAAYTRRIFSGPAVPHRIYTRLRRTLTGSDLPRHHDGEGDAIPETPTMLDLLFLALTVGFFAAAVAYVHACDRL